MNLLSLFSRFPEDPVRREEWARKVRREDEKGKLWVPSGRAWLCSKHFEPKWFDKTGHITRLRNGAVPTVFDFPSHLQVSELYRYLLPSF